MNESDIQAMVADYLRLRYPGVLFHSDFGSGIKLTMGQAIKQKRLQGGRRAWPDMFIAEPKTVMREGDKYYYDGLFIELKREGTRLTKKNGEPANDHIKEQLDLLAELSLRGYAASFAVGFDEAKKIIDEYLA